MNVKQAAISVLVLKNNLKYKDAAEAAAQSLREAGKIGYGDLEPAKWCMDHFLDATGTAWEFDLGELFATDKSVRKRVFTEVIRRTVKALTDSEEKKLSGYGVGPAAKMQRQLDAVIDPVITIMQQNYEHDGWWGALGNFGLTMQVVNKTPDGKRFFVKLSGSDYYKWAPQQNRETKELHELGDMLVRMKKAKMFDQIAKPRTFVVNAADYTLRDGQNTILEKLGDHHRQINPDNRHERLRHQIDRYFE